MHPPPENPLKTGIVSSNNKDPHWEEQNNIGLKKHAGLHLVVERPHKHYSDCIQGYKG